jgi:hypothetical protein
MKAREQLRLRAFHWVIAEDKDFVGGLKWQLSSSDSWAFVDFICAYF